MSELNAPWVSYLSPNFVMPNSHAPILSFIVWKI